MREISLPGFSAYQFVWHVVDSNTFVIIEDAEALVFDPVDTDELFCFLSDKRINKASVILTHEHFDHISGLNRIRGIMDCMVYANRVCSENIRSEKKNLSSMADILISFHRRTKAEEGWVTPFRCSAADRIFEDNRYFTWKNHSVELFTTKGHTDGSICVMVDGKYLFSGDTLLSIPTIVRLPGGNRRAFLDETIPRLEGMSEKIAMVFPGHGDVGCFGKMMQIDHFL